MNETEVLMILRETLIPNLCLSNGTEKAEQILNKQLIFNVKHSGSIWNRITTRGQRPLAVRENTLKSGVTRVHTRLVSEVCESKQPTRESA